MWPLRGSRQGTLPRLRVSLRPQPHKLTVPSGQHIGTTNIPLTDNGAVIGPDLMEWNYGEYEGLTLGQIHEARPGWLIFRDRCPGGETPERIGARVDRVIARARAADGDVALFAHGHVLCVLVARWIGLPAGGG